MPSNHLILCHPLLLLPSIFPSIRVFSIESALYIRRPKYWSFSFSISPSNEYSGLISFRIDWFDLLVVQGTLENLLQHQFESVISTVLRLLYGPTLTSIQDYWKNHSFDYMDLCHQSDVSASILLGTQEELNGCYWYIYYHHYISIIGDKYIDIFVCNGSALLHVDFL